MCVTGVSDSESAGAGSRGVLSRVGSSPELTGARSQAVFSEEVFWVDWVMGVDSEWFWSLSD